MKFWKSFFSFQSALGLFLFITGKYIFPVCEFLGMRIRVEGGGFVPMKCLFAYHCISFISAGIFLFSLAAVFLGREKRERILILLFLAFLYCGIIFCANFSPGVCSSTTMPCRTATLPAWIVSSFVGLVLCFLGIIISSISGGNEKKP